MRERKKYETITREESEMIQKKIERVVKKEEQERQKEIRKVIVELEENQKDDCINEIFFWRGIAGIFRGKRENFDLVKIRLRELEKEFKLSEQEELIRFWIAEILFDLNIIAELSSDIATEWLLESQECEIQLVRSKKNG